MPQLTLCCFPQTSARAAMIALEEAGAHYDTHLYDIMRGDQFTLSYLTMNPKGQIPVLIVDGHPLTESVAILNYLADSFPHARLAPSDPLLRGEALSVVSWLASGSLTALLRIVRPYRISGDPGAAGGIAAMARTALRENLAIAERHLQGRTWWLGEWSIADAYLYFLLGDARRFGADLRGFENLAAFASRMDARPAVQRVIEWERKTLAAHEGRHPAPVAAGPVDGTSP